MGRWKAADITAFGRTSNVVLTEAEIKTLMDAISQPFSAGGDRIVKTGTKIWPVKGTDVRKLWSGKANTMTRDIVATEFRRIPDNPKFSRFAELNKTGKQLYIVVMFPKALRDPSDAENVMTYGYIVDLNRTEPAPASY